MAANAKGKRPAVRLRLNAFWWLSIEPFDGEIKCWPKEKQRQVAAFLIAILAI
jgi:hypothetical protein